MDTPFLPKPKVVLYHGVTDGQAEEKEGIFNYRNKFITPEAFARQLAYFKRHYTVLPLVEFVDKLQNNTLPPQALAITFDDGYANNYHEAFTLLQKAGLPATFFITTGFIEGTPLGVDCIEHAIGTTPQQSLTLQLGHGAHTFQLRTLQERIAADLALRAHLKKLAPKKAAEFLQELATKTGVDLARTLAASPYRPLTWAQMQEMEQGGMTFAPHTVTHPILSHASKAEAEHEIAHSKKILEERLANPLAIFAYPNGGMGDYSGETIALLKHAGFSAALTTKPAYITAPVKNMFALPRYTLDGTNSFYRFRIKISDWYESLYALFYSRLLRMLVIGGISVVVQTIVFEALGLYWHIVSPATAVLIGGELGILLNFTLNQRYSFKERVAHSAPLLERLVRFHLVVTGSLFIQWLLVTLATNYTHNIIVIHVAYVLGIVLGFISNYIGYHLFVWKAPPANKTL